MFEAFHVMKTPKNKIHQSQSVRDFKKLQRRIKENGEKFNFVGEYLDRYFGTHVNALILNSLAKIIMEKHGLQLDRLAKRNRSALLCWFSENWDLVQPVLRQLNFAKDSVQRSSIQPRKPEYENIRTTPLATPAFSDPFSLDILLNRH